ncbi:MAG: ester cyclase [Acidobacteriota bacterium]
MKKLLMVIPLVILLCFTFSCQDKEAMAELEKFKAQAAVEEQNKASFRYMLEETDKGNYAAWEEVCSPDYICHFAGFPKPMSLEEHIQANRTFLVAFPDFHHEINDIVAEAEKVTARVTLTGTHEGEFMGIPPTGNKIEYTAFLTARFSDKRIVELWGVADMMTLMQQLGMELKPKEAEK